MKSNFSGPQEFIGFVYSKFTERNTQKSHWLKKGVLCTAQINGIPSARTVVIRDVNTALELEIHTDARSNKVLDLLINPKAEILFYDPKKETQLKCFGKAIVINSGPELSNAWAKVPENSKKQYTSLLAPGTVLKNSNELSYKALSHFCIIKLQLEGLEYLQLGNPHKRIRLIKKNEEFVLENLVP